jgi:hypothetical protein
MAQEYKQTPRPAGIYCVRNTATGRCLLGASPNLPGIINRHRFTLTDGSHRDKELQADWNALGEDSFEFDVLDELELPDDPAYDSADDLKVLLQMWIDKLTAAGVELYPTTARADG